jgi:hypothetical protein
MKETSADGLIFIVSIYNITIIIIIAKTTGARCTEIPPFLYFCLHTYFQ